MHPKEMMDATENESYQILVCNIKYGTKVHNGASKKIAQSDLPEQISFDVPASVLSQANKNKDSFNDIIEQFTCNLLYKKFGREVYFYQIWLPLED